MALEHDIDKQDEEARRGADSGARQSSRRWETLIRHAEDATRPEKLRLAKLEELKILLREYCMS